MLLTSGYSAPFGISIKYFTLGRFCHAAIIVRNPSQTIKDKFSAGPHGLITAHSQETRIDAKVAEWYSKVQQYGEQQGCTYEEFTNYYQEERWYEEPQILEIWNEAKRVGGAEIYVLEAMPVNDANPEGETQMHTLSETFGKDGFGNSVHALMCLCGASRKFRNRIFRRRKMRGC